MGGNYIAELSMSPELDRPLPFKLRLGRAVVAHPVLYEAILVLVIDDLGDGPVDVVAAVAVFVVGFRGLMTTLGAFDDEDASFDLLALVGVPFLALCACECNEPGFLFVREARCDGGIGLEIVVELCLFWSKRLKESSKGLEGVQWIDIGVSEGIKDLCEILPVVKLAVEVF